MTAREKAEKLVAMWGIRNQLGGNAVQIFTLDIERALLETIEEAAHIVETWAQDNETVQPSFTRMAAEIRKMGEH